MWTVALTLVAALPAMPPPDGAEWLAVGAWTGRALYLSALVLTAVVVLVCQARERKVDEARRQKSDEATDRRDMIARLTAIRATLPHDSPLIAGIDDLIRQAAKLSILGGGAVAPAPQVRGAIGVHPTPKD